MNQNELLKAIKELRQQVFELKDLHMALLASHSRRVALLDELIASQTERDRRLDSLIDYVLREDEGDWWKRGESPWT